MPFLKRNAPAPGLLRFLLHFFIHPVQVGFQGVVNPGGTEPRGGFRPAYPAPAGDVRVGFPPAGNPDAEFMNALLGALKGFFQGGAIRGIPLRVQGRIQFRVRHGKDIVRVAHGVAAGIVRQLGSKGFIKPGERRLERPRPQGGLVPFFKYLPGTDIIGQGVQAQVHPAFQGLLP